MTAALLIGALAALATIFLAAFPDRNHGVII